ncbi:MAG: autotransporter outer membrane beta-barrel domain-containing protein [Bacteriovoracia bacterium]
MFRQDSVLFALVVALGAPSTALGATTTINKVTYGKTADAGSVAVTPGSGPEFSLRLKKVFLFPAVDDVSGVLAPKLDEKIAQLLSRNIRFDLVRDPQVIKALNPDESSYAKAAVNQEVHREAAKTTGADTTALLRTKTVGNETVMVLEFRDANGDILFSETGSIPGYSAMDARWGLIEKLFRSVLAKLPFEGSVTGRTASTITVDLGLGDVQEGEELDIARIVSIQRHPLLKTVIGTDYVRVGRARVTTVDKYMSFAEIIEEFPSERITTGSKILKAKPMVRRTDEPGIPPRNEENQGRRSLPLEKKIESDPFDDRLQGDFDRAKQRYGSAGLNLLYGSLNHSQTVNNTTNEYSGSGLGGKLEGELWITKNWILNLAYAFQSATLTGTSGVLGDTSWSRAEGFAGYRFFPAEAGEGTSITGSLGYQSMNFDLPSSSALNVGAKKYTGIALRLQAEMQLQALAKINAGFSLQPFSSVTDTGKFLGAPKSGTALSFGIGWNYRFADSLWAKIGFEFDSASCSYENTSTVTNKRFAIGPGIYYSF